MFRFKQFNVNHQQSTMKVGTDGILLGCWANPQNPQKALDVGTGCGLISLILAQRFQMLQIQGIDIHSPSVEEALQNFKNSPWQQRLSAQQIDFLQFAENIQWQYDIIISNPPYFQNSLSAKGEGRNLARHTNTLSFEELAKGVSQLLAKHGQFFCILPPDEALFFENQAKKQLLFCNRKTKVKTTSQKSYERYLLAFSFEQTNCLENELHIRDDKGDYTAEYLALVKDFYLFA